MWFLEWLSTVPVDRRAAVLAEFEKVRAEMMHKIGWLPADAAHAAALAVYLRGFHA